MTRDKIRHQLFLPAVIQKFPYPQFVLDAADGRPAHPETHIQRFYGIKCPVEQLKIFFHIGIFPETWQIRFIPHFDRPGQHFFLTVTLHKMPECGADQIAPCLIVFRRRHISFPVKDRLLSGRHFIRHKSQFQKWFQAAFPIAVHHHIQISKIIFRSFYTGRILIFLIDRHIVRKKSVAADMAKADLVLHHPKLILIRLLQRKSHSSRSNAEINVIMKQYFFPVIDLVNSVFFHIGSFLRSVFFLNPTLIFFRFISFPCLFPGCCLPTALRLFPS